MKKSGEIVIAEWYQAKSVIQKQWGRLEEQDLHRINGHLDVLIGKLVDKYDYDYDEAKRLAKLYLQLNHIDR